MPDPAIPLEEHERIALSIKHMVALGNELASRGRFIDANTVDTAIDLLRDMAIYVAERSTTTTMSDNPSGSKLLIEKIDSFCAQWARNPRGRNGVALLQECRALLSMAVTPSAPGCTGAGDLNGPSQEGAGGSAAANARVEACEKDAARLNWLDKWYVHRHKHC